MRDAQKSDTIYRVKMISGGVVICNAFDWAGDAEHAFDEAASLGRWDFVALDVIEHDCAESGRAREWRKTKVTD